MTRDIGTPVSAEYSFTIWCTRLSNHTCVLGDSFVSATPLINASDFLARGL